MQFQVNPVVVEGLEGLIPHVDKLRRTWTTVRNYDEDAVLPTVNDLLPMIVVLGSPESGKSSVLESIVQSDFIPTAAGTRTLCPLVMELVRIGGEQAYARFVGRNERYTDLAHVRREIESISLNNTSYDPIRLTIYSQKVTNITIVDLPALTKVSDDGQPENMSEGILSLARTYIEKANCIILIVSPANDDLVNSEAIKISREIDPDGKRTFGVLTKVDLVDNFTNVLQERSSMFKFPWICVYNRSQQDVENKVDLASALVRENAFFANKPEHASSMGSGNLTKRISKVMESMLTRNIKDMEIILNPVGTRFIHAGPSNSVPWTGLPKSLLGAVRSQGRGKKNCGFQAGMVVTETHYIVDGANKDPPEAFMYKLSLSDLTKSYEREYPLDAAERKVEGGSGGSLLNTISLLKRLVFTAFM